MKCAMKGKNQFSILFVVEHFLSWNPQRIFADKIPETCLPLVKTLVPKRPFGKLVLGSTRQYSWNCEETRALSLDLPWSTLKSTSRCCVLLPLKLAFSIHDTEKIRKCNDYLFTWRSDARASEKTWTWVRVISVISAYHFNVPEVTLIVLTDI